MEMEEDWPIFLFEEKSKKEWFGYMKPVIGTKKTIACIGWYHACLEC